MYQTVEVEMSYISMVDPQPLVFLLEFFFLMEKMAFSYIVEKQEIVSRARKSIN